MNQTKKSKTKRLKSLVLTETVEKAKTLRKFLSRQYQVIATDGFLRDLPKTKLGYDIENNFEEKYITVRGKGKLLEQIRKEAITARRIYLATNPDSEGELAAWHFCCLFGINPISNCRMILNDLTEDSIKTSTANAKAINMKAVEIYKTQQAIERLFIYEINPLLWYKIYRGVSISRSQAFILKMICDQEKKLQPITKKSDLDEQFQNEPLTLKTLLYAASKILNMQVGTITITLRQLYEGINIDKTVSGLITYFKNEIKPANEKFTPESIKPFISTNQYKLYNLIWQRHHNEKLQITAKSEDENNRYNDYLLMDELESKEINWSESFSMTVCGLVKRKYVKLTKEGYKPTELGNEVLNILKQNFSTIITAKMMIKIESQIQEVAAGTLTKNQAIEAFYKQFKPCLTKAYDKIGTTDLTPKDPPVIETDEVCEKCGNKMVIKHSRYGLFLACSGYPECKNTKPYVEYVEEKCPKCGGRLAKRQWNRSKEFYSCEKFPDCDFSTWDEPQHKSCDICGSTLFLHRFKDHPPMLYCGNEKCSSRENHPINNIIENWKAKLESKKK